MMMYWLLFPGTMVQAMMEEVAIPANQPLPEEDEFEEEEDEEDEGSPKEQVGW